MAVETFMLYHDLSGNGKMKRDETSRSKVASLRKEKEEICKGKQYKRENGKWRLSYYNRKWEYKIVHAYRYNVN